MRIESRLEKLEQQAKQLPPDGAGLLREMERMPEEGWRQWLAARTDAELEAMTAMSPELQALTDEELEMLAR